MEKDIIKIIQGEKVEILELSLFLKDLSLILFLKVCYKGCVFNIRFNNVSRVNLENISFPMEIQGFEILSNKNKGWQEESNYMIHDFEENRISFFCEDFELYN